MDFYSKIVGTTFPREGQEKKGIELIPDLVPGQELKLIREPTNPFDKNAIQIKWDKNILGFIPKGTAANLAINMDAGDKFYCEVSEVTGGGNKEFGCNIHITQIDTSPLDNSNAETKSYLDEI